MSVEVAIRRALQSLEPRAIAIQGTWGRGKSYMWKERIKTIKPIHWKTYSYVSLFGVNSLEELKLAIYTARIKTSVAQLPESSFRWSWSPRVWWAYLRRYWRHIVGASFRIPLPKVGNIGPLYAAVAFLRVRRQLICLDDIERRGEKLALADVLGLVALLCEERRCGVVVILNEQVLLKPDQETWHRLREKVFHSEVTYQPTANQCIDLVFRTPGENAWHDAARIPLQQAEVSNIRILTRVRDALRELADAYDEKLTDSTRDRMASSVAILIYCHNAAGEGAPPMKRVLGHSRLALIGLNKPDERTEEEKIWDSLISLWDYVPENIDKILADMVRNGYFDGQKLAEEIRKRDALVGKSNVDAEFSEVWRLYHDSFDDNSSEIVSRFKNVFPRAAATTHATNADSTIGLLRKLGEEQLADEFIQLWLEPRRQGDRSQLTLREAEIFRPIEDVKFKAAIMAAEKDAKPLPNVTDAMATLAEQSGDTDLALEALATADLSRISDWVLSSRGREVNSALRYLFSQHPSRNFIEEAQSAVRRVLQDVAATSEINRLRVHSLGVTLTEDLPPDLDEEHP